MFLHFNIVLYFWNTNIKIINQQKKLLCDERYSKCYDGLDLVQIVLALVSSSAFLFDGFQGVGERMGIQILETDPLFFARIWKSETNLFF